MKLQVRINSPEKLLWEGEAEWVSSVNVRGPFDILPLHANFISIIHDKSIKIKTDAGIKEYSFANSVIYANKNRVLIYTNI